MKRIILVFATACMLLSCGKKAVSTEKETANDIAENAENLQIYTNDKYGFSVSLPAELKRSESLITGDDDSAIYYTPDTEEGGICLNRVDIGGSKQIFDEVYTPEKVKEEFENDTSGKEGLLKKECKDMEFSYYITGEYVTEIHRCVYSGTKKAEVIVCFEKDHESQLGGDIAEKILASLKFK